MKDSPKRYINPFLSDEENNKVNFTTSYEDEKLEKSLEPSSVPSESLEKAKELYIDKSVTECELPELIACYEASGFHVVKDICVDEGNIERDKERHELSRNLVTVNGDKHDDMIKDELKLFVESDIVRSIENCGSDTSMQIGDVKLGSSSDSLNNSSDTDVDQRPEAQSGGSEADTSNEIKINENAPSNSNNVKQPTIIGVREPPLDTQSAPNHHDTASDNIIMANQLQRGGESSFSMTGPISGLITYSGPIAFTGNVSHRSDGSNTSVGSFAFPILQTEWNSSPVRMAKVDPTQSPKHRGWRHAFMCCRF